jgi:hypothetical protein
MKLALAALASLAMLSVSGPAAPDVYDGQPRFDQGDAYHLWRDGGKWHLRWVAAEHGREFKGVVAVTGGTFKSVKENDSEKETLAFLPSLQRLTVTTDRVDPGIRIPDAPSANRATIRQDGTDKIVFESRTTNSIGGFDFVPDDSVTAIQIDLLIDKRSTPGMVRLGKSSKKATELPLTVSLTKPPGT